LPFLIAGIILQAQSSLEALVSDTSST